MRKFPLRQIQLNTAVFCGFVLLIFLTPDLSNSASAQDSRLSIQQIETKIRPIISKWQVNRQILVDPRIVRVISGGLWHFSEIYGWPGNDVDIKSRVASLLKNDKQLYQIIDDFLEDCFSGKEVMTVFARAARAIESSSSAAGWPEKTANGFVLVDLSESVPKTPIRIISESLRSPDELVASAAVVGAGGHEIVASDGRSWSFSAKGDWAAVEKASTGVAPPKPLNRGRTR